MFTDLLPGQTPAVTLTPGEQVEGLATEDKYTYFAVKLPPRDGRAQQASKRQLVVHVQEGNRPEGAAHDIDVYAGIEPLTRPTLALHDAAIDLTTTAAGASSTRKLFVDIPNASPNESPAGWVYLGVRLYDSSSGGGAQKKQASFSLRVDLESVDDPGPAATNGASSSGESKQPSSSSSSSSASAALPLGTSLCDNCGAAVPDASKSLHTVMCQRNNVRCRHPDCGAVIRRGPAGAEEHSHCPDCGDVMPGRAVPKHVRLYHTPQPCPNGCGALHMKQAQLSRHMRSECPQRWILCRFCGGTVRAEGPPRDYGDRLKGFTQHESYCGARTAPCAACRKGVQLKYQEAHWAAAHPGQAPLPPAFDDSVAPSGDDAASSSSSSAMRVDDDVSDSSSSGGGGYWPCPACSYHNPFLTSAAGVPVCGMCGYSSSSGSNSAGGSARGSPTNNYYAASGALKPLPCRNQACSGSASKQGDAASLQLCSRCFRVFGLDLGHPEHTDDDDDNSNSSGDSGDEVLLSRYRHQLDRGCGRVGCGNVHCASGARASVSSGAGGGVKPFADASSHLAWLLQEAQPPASRYYVCVDATGSRQLAWPVMASVVGGGAAAADAFSSSSSSSASSLAQTASLPPLSGKPRSGTSSSLELSQPGGGFTSLSLSKGSGAGGSSSSSSSTSRPQSRGPTSAAADQKRKASSASSRVHGAMF